MASPIPLAEPRDEETPSLSQRILNDIRARIVSGEWGPGFRIPFEHELTVEYGCSRMTVNKALSQLAASGLIERRRRSGSFVRQPRSQAAVLEIHDIGAEVAALGLDYSYELIERRLRPGTADDVEMIGPERPKRVLQLYCRHFAGGRPFCLEQRLVNLDAVPDAEQQSFAEVAAGSWLVQHVPWTSAEHRISAAAASVADAELLDIDNGAPCLVIERRTWGVELPVTHAVFTYSAERHSVVARFEPK